MFKNIRKITPYLDQSRTDLSYTRYRNYQNYRFKNKVYYKNDNIIVCNNYLHNLIGYFSEKEYKSNYIRYWYKSKYITNDIIRYVQFYKNKVLITYNKLYRKNKKYAVIESIIDFNINLIPINKPIINKFWYKNGNLYKKEDNSISSYLYYKKNECIKCEKF